MSLASSSFHSPAPTGAHPTTAVPQSIGSPAVPQVAEPIDPQQNVHESIHGCAARVWGAALPPAARKEQIGHYLADVDRLRSVALATSQLLSRNASVPVDLAAVRALVTELSGGLWDLQNRRSVIIPNIKHEADNLDAVNDLAYDAHTHILNIEALLDVISKRLDQGRDGHLISICDLCVEEMPKLRFSLYGEDMGP